MKIVIALLVISIAAWFSYQRFSSDSERKRVFTKALTIVPQLEPRTAGYWMKHNNIKIIEVGEFKRFHYDTLYVKFGIDNSIDIYIDGVLLLNKDAGNYTDTGFAFSLLFGIANHIFDQQGNTFTEADQSTVLKVRAYQYIADIIKLYNPVHSKSFHEKESYKMKKEYAVAFNSCGESLECRVIKYNEIASKY